MLEKTLCYTTRSEIRAFTTTANNTIAFSTKLHGAKIFSLESCSSIKNLSIELLGYKTTAVAFNAEASLLAFANTNIIYIISTKDKLLLQTIKTSDGPIELISFVVNSKYIITGTEHGRVMQYRYDGRAQLSRLCSFGHNIYHANRRISNNYVSAFAFYDKLFASSGYGGIITILKMDSYTKRKTIDASKVKINVLCFLDYQRIVSGNIDGLIQIHSLKKYQSVKNISTPFKNINNIILMPNPNFLLVSGENKNIILIDIQTAKVVSTSYLKFESNISKIVLYENKELIIALENKNIYKVTLATTDDLKSHILHNEIDKAFNLIDSDPMLRGTREHKRVEVMYEKMYMQAIDALIQNKAHEARKLMLMFSEIASKKEDVKSIFKAFEYYPRFQTLCLEKKYSLAYAMADKHPALRRTHQYKKIEETFKENFSFAQKQIVINRIDIAKEILSPYITVISKKPLLNLILNQNDDYVQFLKVVNKKDYVLIEKLIKKNPSFAQMPIYTALEDKLQKQLHEIQELINKTKIEEAIEKIKTLVNIIHLQDALKDLYQECKLAQKLQTAYENDDFVKCYEILDSSSALDSMELTTLLEIHWTKLMNESEEAALKGDIKSIKKILADLLHVKSRRDKIGDLLRLSFQIKIKALLAKKSFKNAENIIYSYIDIFNLDSEIRYIMRMYEKFSSKKLAITSTQHQQTFRDNWLTSSLMKED